MKPVIHSRNQHTIVYDADRIPEPEHRLFDPAYWQEKGAIKGQVAGRGDTLFLNTSFGPAVLRHYLRGGWAAKFSKDRYCYLGIKRSRPFKEFEILRKMSALGLPVPVPLAALLERRRLSYRGVLLMQQIEDVKPLGAYLGQLSGDSRVWADSGNCIRQFHDSGVNHVDLNANNLLVNPESGKIYLIDFDRCSISPGSIKAGGSNLARLKRSLIKLWPDHSSVSVDKCWATLMDGYRG